MSSSEHTYFLTINGRPVPVCEQVYRASHHTGSVLTVCAPFLLCKSTAKAAINRFLRHSHEIKSA